MRAFDKKIDYCAALLVGALSTVAPAQTENARFTRFTVEDGLSQGSVSAIIQDRQGFLWLGTLDGRNKFDGYTFQIYKHDIFDSSSLSNNWINVIYEDRARFGSARAMA